MMTIERNEASGAYRFCIDGEDSDFAGVMELPTIEHWQEYLAGHGSEVGPKRTTSDIWPVSKTS